MSWTSKALGAAMTEAVKHLEHSMQVLRRKYNVEKIQLTQEQADVISKLLKKMSADRLIDTHIKQIWKDEYNALNHMEVSKVARAVLVGYEVIPQFKVGDWVINIHTAEIGQVEAIRKVGGAVDNDERIVVDSILNYPDSLRHATPEEIQQEKKRRFWEKLGREVDEWEEGDIVGVEGSKFITYISYEDLDRGEVEFPRFTAGDNEYFPLNKIRLVTPVEKRLDK